MVEAIISVTGLKKTFRTHKRGAGIIEALRSLVKRKYVNFPALKGIDLQVNAGEIVGFIGPNGAGKSTTIKILSGVLFPDEGSVSVIGFEPWTQREQYVKNIGVVFGQKSQFSSWDLPALDGFYFLRDIYEVPEKEFEARLKAFIKLLDVEEVVKRQVRTLSLGERMRCELIAALLHNPKLVFLDEPTIGVDLIAREIIHNFIVEQNEKFGTTFVITTHDMNDIEKLCKRVVVINHGGVVYDGLLSDLKKRYAKVKYLRIRFSEPQNEIKCEGGKVTKKNSYEYAIKVGGSNIHRMHKIISRLMDKYKIADIVVSDPPVEDVIKEIYKK
jgi:ABC-2 type transport system ATP-binding protein